MDQLENVGPAWKYKGKLYASPQDVIEVLELQIDEYRRILKGIATLAIEFSECDQERCPAGSMQRDAQRALMEKRICEHEWAHIEDSHFFCAKCRATADFCGACGAEYTKTLVGRLVCLKCNPQ